MIGITDGLSIIRICYFLKQRPYVISSRKLSMMNADFYSFNLNDSQFFFDVYYRLLNSYLKNGQNRITFSKVYSRRKLCLNVLYSSCDLLRNKNAEHLQPLVEE